MRKKHGEKIHKLAINAAFTCPNRDGSKGIGGCTFCNNASFNPNARKPLSINEQITNGMRVIRKRTGAKKYIAYFQAYTNTYADVASLRKLYDQALSHKSVIGISVGTRPDCVPEPVLKLLADYQQAGHEVWLELGLQSVFDESLQKVKRGHDFSAYVDALKRSKKYGLQVCTHLIVGLPGETPEMSLTSHQRVIELGVDGLKLHPLHVVKGTQLANDWRKGLYQTMDFEHYIQLATEMVKRTPDDIIFHRLTATAEKKILLAPAWCGHKWNVLNSINSRLCQENSRQGCAA